MLCSHFYSLYRLVFKLIIMKKGLIFLVGTIMVLHTTGQSAADKGAVNAGVSAFMNSWNSHNFEDIGNYTTKGFYYISPDAEVFDGLDSARKKLQSMHRGGSKIRRLKKRIGRYGLCLKTQQSRQ